MIPSKPVRTAIAAVGVALALAFPAQAFAAPSPAVARTTGASAVTGTSAACAQVPANVDSAHFDDSVLSDAQLHAYGLQRRGSLPQAKWAMLVENAKHHVCGNHYDDRAHGEHYDFHNPSDNWDGNYSNGSDGPYTEVDTVFHVPTVASNSPGGLGAIWVGLGGVGNSNLVQTGVSFSKNSDGTSTYQAWVENIAATSGNPCGSAGDQTRPCYLAWSYYPVSPGDQIQVRVTGNDMYVANGTTGHKWSYEVAYGPQPNESTADFIIERPGGYDLPNFGTATFYGMGATGHAGYNGPYWQTHDYFTLVACDNFLCTGTHNLINIGSLIYNTTFGPPNDSNSLTWVAAN